MDNVKTTATQSKPTIEVKAITQREAVYLEIVKILKQEKISVGPRQQVQTLLNEKHIQAMSKNICAGFKSGSIALKETDANKKKLSDPKLLEKYVAGLINNWLRRDERLNGTANKVQ